MVTDVAGRPVGRAPARGGGRTAVVGPARWRLEVLLAVLLAGLAAWWSLATPAWSSPDENQHVLKAWSVAHGTLHVDPVPAIAGTGGYLDVPRGLADPSATVFCSAFRPPVPASCVEPATDDATDVVVANSAARYAPPYYAVVGAASLVVDQAHAPLAMRLVSAVLFGVLGASALGALARTRRPAVAVGAGLLALTPMAFFLGGVVNPNGLEIAGACALWTNLALLLRAGSAMSRSTSASLARRAAVAGGAVVVTRSLSPVWLVVVVACCLLLADRRSLRRLRTPAATASAAALAVVTAGALAWVVVSRSLVVGSLVVPPPLPLLDRLELARDTQADKWRQAVGSFGWLDAPLPDAQTTTWGVAVVAVAAVGLALGTGRHRAALVLVALSAWLLPVVVEAQSINTTGVIWQGRYSLPLLVGVPLLTAVALGCRAPRRRGERVLRVGTGAGVVAVVVTVVVLQVLAFRLALHRHVDGLVDGAPTTLDGPWQPRLGATTSLLLDALTWAVGVAVVAALLLRRPRVPR